MIEMDKSIDKLKTAVTLWAEEKPDEYAAVRDWITENPDGYNKLKDKDLQLIDNESIKNKIELL